MKSSQESLVQQEGQKLLFPRYVPTRRAKVHPNTEDTDTCPECGAETITDMDKCEIYCRDCGLVVKASIHYVGNRKINYPYGTLL